MPNYHNLSFADYLEWISRQPLDDYKWWREVQKYLLSRPDQRRAYVNWLNSGECLSEYYKLFSQ